MQLWLILSLCALLCWGFWGLFANLTAHYVDGFSAVIWEVLGAMLTGGIVLVWLLRGSGVATDARGIGFGVATGLTYTLGLVFLFFALGHVAGNGSAASSDSGPSVHTVLVLTALYPIVAVLLNYFVLSAPLNARQILGTTVGISGMIILVTSD